MPWQNPPGGLAQSPASGQQTAGAHAKSSDLADIEAAVAKLQADDVNVAIEDARVRRLLRLLAGTHRRVAANGSVARNGPALTPVRLVPYACRHA